MRILFCADPLDSRVPNSAYADQIGVAKTLGWIMSSVLRQFCLLAIAICYCVNPVWAAPSPTQSPNSAKDAPGVVGQPSPPLALTGRVVDSFGKPVAGATVLLSGAQQFDQTSSDAHGHFAFDWTSSKITLDMKLVAYTDTAACLAAMPVGSGKDVVITLSTNAQGKFLGAVQDQAGKPISNTTVTLFRSNEKNGFGTSVDTKTTDVFGRYQFAPHIQIGFFSMSAQKAGYMSGSSQGTMEGLPGQDQTFSPIVLNPANNIIGGQVIDKFGHPIAGAFVTLPQVLDAHATSDDQGRFYIGSAPNGLVQVMIQSATGQSAYVTLTSGTVHNVITAETQTEQQADAKRFFAFRDTNPDSHGMGEQASLIVRSACRVARAGDKSVILVFHASWCGGCYMFHQFVRDPQVSQMIKQHFVVQEIDIWEKDHAKRWENPGGTTLYAKYGGTKLNGDPQGVPFFVVLDANGKKLADSNVNGQNFGYPADGDSAAAFLSILKRASPSLTAIDMAKLKIALFRNSYE